VSLTALRTEAGQYSPANDHKSVSDSRRSSLPTTQEEITIALRRTAAVERPLPRPKTPTLAQLGASQKPRPHTSHYAKQTSPRAVPCSARVGPRGSLHPTEINISDQGIENLK
jgi:hypothetical protein